MYELFALFICEPYTEEDIKSDEDDQYYPFSAKGSADICKKVYNGSRVLPKATARFMISHFQKDDFVSFLENKDDIVLSNLCSQLSQHGIECNIDNIAEVASNCFHSFIEAALEENDTIQTGLSASAEVRVESNDATNQDTLLLLETDNKCPLCGAPLMFRNGKRKDVKRYKITQIFPDNVSMDLYLAFSKYLKMSIDYSHPDNLIALCSECSTDYLSDPTIEEFLRLKKIKTKLQQRRKIQMSMENIDIEAEICDVVNGLSNIDDSRELAELRMDALKVQEKIEPVNRLLIDAITDDATHYYNYIEELFAEADEKESGTFDRVASEVNLAYKKIKDNDLTQNEIFSYMSHWLKEKLPIEHRNDMAISAVISFFVQNCEVFDEISE